MVLYLLRVWPLGILVAWIVPAFSPSQTAADTEDLWRASVAATEYISVACADFPVGSQQPVFLEGSRSWIRKASVEATRFNSMATYYIWDTWYCVQDTWHLLCLRYLVLTVSEILGTYCIQDTWYSLCSRYLKLGVWDTWYSLCPRYLVLTVSKILGTYCIQDTWYLLHLRYLVLTVSEIIVSEILDTYCVRDTWYLLCLRYFVLTVVWDTWY